MSPYLIPAELSGKSYDTRFASSNQDEPRVHGRTVQLMKNLRPLFKNIQFLMNGANKSAQQHRSLEDHCILFSTMINDYINHLVLNGLKYKETTCISNNYTVIMYTATIANETLSFAWSSTTRHRAQIVAKATFAMSMYNVMHAQLPTPLDEIDLPVVDAQSETGVDATKRDAPEDSLFQVTASNQFSNTEMTQDSDVSSPLAHITDSHLQEQATTEPIYNYAPMTERLIHIANVNLSQTDQPNTEIWSANVPDGLYDALDSVVSSVLRNFTSISCDVEFTFKVNANQAQCGRYIVSHFPAKNLAVDVPDNVYRQLTREHAIIDVATSNDVVYTVPFEYIRPWVPIETNEVGTISGGIFARISLNTLSGVRIAENGQQTVPVQIFARFTRVHLTGMRFPVPAQSDKPTIPSSEIDTADPTDAPIADSLPPVVSTGIKAVSSIADFIPHALDVFANPAGTVTAVLNPLLTKTVERTMNFFGGINNDHPPDITVPKPLLPQATHSFANVVGAVPLRKLRIEQTANTPQFDNFRTTNCPKTTTEIAQIPGFYTSFEVSTTNQTGDLLIELPVALMDNRYTSGPTVPAAVQPDDARPFVQLPPLLYMMNMYTDYVGTFEYTFDAIKTPSHNFSLQAAYIPFNGVPGQNDFKQLQSCKWTTLDFRVNNRAKFTTPFISYHLMRQYTNATSGRGDLPNNPLYSTATPVPAAINFTNNIPLATPTPMRDPGKIVVRMLNHLNPTPIVSNTIEIIVYVSAQPGFKFLVPRPFRSQVSAIPHYVVNPIPWAIAPTGYSNEIVGNIIPAQSSPGMSVQAGDEMTPPSKVEKKIFGTMIQSMELHDDILSLCKRTYFYTSLRGTALAAFGGNNREIFSDTPIFASCPVVPYIFPTRFATINDPNPLSQNRGPVNPRDALLSCFRWMRGGINITVVLKPTNGYDKKQLMVTHIPPVGLPVHLTGNQDRVYLETFASGLMPLISNTPGCGYASELIVPSVNPTLTVEVPFYSPTSYIDLQAPLNRLATQTPGDILGQTLGQIELTSLTNIPVQVTYQGNDLPAVFTDNVFDANLYSALADDAMLYHFIGVPPTVYNNAWRGTPFQGGLTNPPPLPKTRDQIQTELLRSGIESNPGPSIMSMFTKPSFFESTSKDTNCSVGAKLENQTSWWDNVKAIVKLPSTIGKVTQSLDVITQKFDEIKTNLALFIPNIDPLNLSVVITSMLNAYINPTKLAIVTASLSFISLFPFAVKASVNALITKATSLCRPSGDVLGQSNVDLFQSNSAIVSIFSSLLIEGLITHDKVSRLPQHETVTKNIVLQCLGNVNFARTGAICVLVYRLCSAITVLWNRLRRWCESYRTVSLLEVNQDFVDNFMIDYEYVMSELNAEVFNFTRMNRDRYWTTVISAYYLQAIMVKHKSINPILKSACTHIIHRANALNSKVTAPPVRYEPFVLWLYGTAGVGKTSAINGLLIDLAKQIKIHYPTDPVYVVKPNSAFMNGLNRQPITIIDDCGATNDPTFEPNLLANFMAIKSSARMLIDKPRLEEKDAEFVAPLVGCTSNFKYWPVQNAIRHPAALDRRRDVLVKLEWSPLAIEYFQQHPQTERKVGSLPPEITKDNAHQSYVVQHSIYRQGAVPEGFTAAPDDPARTFAEFEEYLREVHLKYHNTQIDLMYERYKKSLVLAKQASESLNDEASLKLALVSVTLGCEESRSDVPLETLRYALFSLENAAPNYYRTLPQSTRAQIQHMIQNPSPAHTQDAVPGQSDYSFALPMPIQGSPWYRQQISELQLYQPDEQTYTTRIARFLQNTSQPLPHWLNPHSITMDIDLTNGCSVCSENPNENGSLSVAALCPMSTADNQHWVCNNCLPRLERDSCPYCRHETLAFITEQQRQVSIYKKAWYWMKLLGQFSQRMFERIFTMNNFLIFAIVSQVATLFGLLYASYVELQALSEDNKDIRWYIDTYGTEPHYVGRHENGSPLFNVSGRIFYRSPQDDLVPIVNNPPIISAQSETPSYNTDPILPTKRLHECCHVNVNYDNANIIVSHDPETETDVAEFFIHTHVLAKWPLYVCECPSTPPPPGLLPDETEEFFQTVDYSTDLCKMRHHQSRLFQKIIEDSQLAWEIDPTLIPNTFKNVVPQQSPQDVPTSRWRLIQSQIVSAVRTNVVPLLYRAVSFIQEYLYVIIGFLAILFGFYYGYQVVWNDDDGYVPEIKAQSQGDYNNPTSQALRTNHSHRTIQRPNNPVRAQSEFITMSQNAKSTELLFKKSALKVRHPVVNSDAIGIFGSSMIMPRHAFLTIQHFEKGAETTIISNRQTHTLKLSDCPFRDLPEYEMVVVILPSYFSFRNIIKHFNPDTSSETRIPAKLWCISLTKDKTVLADVTGVSENVPIKLVTKAYNESYTYLNITHSTFRVKGFQSDGLCMSIALNEQGHVIGLHVGGTDFDNTGYMVPMYADVLAIGAQSLGSMEYVRSVEDAPYHTRKSKIVPSLLAPFMHDSITEPCIQRATDPRLPFPSDPLIEGCKTIGAPTLSPDPQLLAVVEDAVFDSILAQYPPPAMPAPVSIDLAINPKLPKLRTIDRDSSVGYPLCTQFVKKGDIYDVLSDGTVHWKQPTVKEQLLHDFDQRSQGNNVDTIFVAHLKDERRTPEKNRKPGGTRVFHISPLELVVNTRRALIPFIDAFCSDPIKSCHGITLNPDSIQWTEMMSKFMEKGHHFIQLDFSKFSDTLPHEFVDSFFKLVNRWYQLHGMLTDPLKLVLQTISQDIKRSKVLVYSDVYQISNGVLQGHPLTSTLNSFVNIIEQVYIYAKITGFTPYQFFNDCTLMVMGDDVAISTNTSLIETYNARSITKAFAELLVTVTDPFDKTLPADMMPKSYPPNKFVLLSRTATRHPSRNCILAPVKLQSIFDVPLWVHGKANRETTCEVVRASLVLAFSHGPTFYQLWVDYLCLVFDAANVLRPVFPSWLAMDYLFYSNIPTRPTTATKCSCTFDCVKKLALLLQNSAKSESKVRSTIARTVISRKASLLIPSPGDEAIVPDIGAIDLQPLYQYGFDTVFTICD